MSAFEAGAGPDPAARVRHRLQRRSDCAPVPAGLRSACRRPQSPPRALLVRGIASPTRRSLPEVGGVRTEFGLAVLATGAIRPTSNLAVPKVPASPRPRSPAIPCRAHAPSPVHPSFSGRSRGPSTRWSGPDGSGTRPAAKEAARSSAWPGRGSGYPSASTWGTTARRAPRHEPAWAPSGRPPNTNLRREGCRADPSRSRRVLAGRA